MDPVRLLTEAVAIRSVSGSEGALARYLVREVAGFSREAFVDDVGNAVAHFGNGPLRVTFLGHIDTVPGEIPVRIEDGKIYGRGAVDAKGALCTGLCAAALMPPGVAARLSLTVIAAVEEESPSSKGARHAVQAYPCPEFLIIGEPSGWDAVTLAYKGRLLVAGECSKANFHSAGDESTAAEEVVDFFLTVKRWVDHRNQRHEGIFDRVQLALQEITSQSDGLKQQARALLGFRLPLELPPGSLQEQLLGLAGSRGVSLSWLGSEEPVRAAKDSPLCRAFRVAIRRQSVRPKLKVKTGTSDMNVVAPHWRVPMLAYGPGDSHFDHRPDEQLDLGEYRRAIAVLSEVLTILAGAS